MGAPRRSSWVISGSCIGNTSKPLEGFFSESPKNGMKCITTPFLSGLCYGPVLAGFYDPWTFVGLCL
jgi:hypothetical protein